MKSVGTGVRMVARKGFMATQTLLGWEQFVELPEREGIRRELDEGRLIETPTPSFLHGNVQGVIFSHLQRWVHETGAEFYITQCVGFRLGEDTERAPDVCAARKETYAGMQRIRGTMHGGAPDVAVEVVSATETAVDLDRKVQQYLKAGTAAVWVVYTETRHIMGYRRSGEARMVVLGQRLEEPELLPGFSVGVEEIFAGVEGLVG